MKTFRLKLSVVDSLTDEPLSKPITRQCTMADDTTAKEIRELMHKRLDEILDVAGVYCDATEITYEQVMEYCKKRCLDLIDHAFLVRLYNNRETIPVEWIRKWISERNDFPTMPYNQHILNMLEDWEKENADKV